MAAPVPRATTYHDTIYNHCLRNDADPQPFYQASTGINSGAGDDSLIESSAGVLCSNPMATALPSRTTTGSVPSGVTRMTLRGECGRRKKLVLIDNLAGACGDDTPEQIQMRSLDTSIRFEPSPNQPSGSWVGQVRYLCIIKTEG